MSKVCKWRTWVVKRAPSSSLKTTYGKPESTKSHVIVALSDSDGITGWGEATPLPMFNGETASGIRLILEDLLLPSLIGHESGDIASAITAMDKAVSWNFSAKAAVDTALHDLIAKELNVPEYVLLGGCARSKVPINRHIGICSVPEAQRLSEQYIKQGFRSIKMKVGCSPMEDIARVKAVRKIIGNAMLRIDANQGYTLQEARTVLSALEGENIQFCEQPLPFWDLKGLASLRRSCGVPIAVDESLQTLHDALQIAECGCSDVFIIKLIKCGGLYKARQIAGLAEAAGIKCVITSTFDSQIGAAHCLHLAIALPAACLPCDLTCYASQYEKAHTCHTIKDGFLVPGRVSGCGVYSIEELKDEM